MLLAMVLTMTTMAGNKLNLKDVVRGTLRSETE